MNSTNKPQKPEIEPTLNGPYKVKNLENLRNSKGDKLQLKPVVFLCRCGGSANKPFCDGTHAKNGFSGEKLTDGSLDKRENVESKKITIHDNRGICSHSGNCTDNLASVFKLNTEPWIDPEGAEAEEIIKTIRKCPSGALSYSIEDVEYRDQDQEPMITVSKDGPYYVTGRVELRNEPRGEGASEEHYTLCRCGGSKNKPFCDGTHWYIKFKDGKN
jgi:CDGSH-type Zn-finger protein